MLSNLEVTGGHNLRFFFPDFEIMRNHKPKREESILFLVNSLTRKGTALITARITFTNLRKVADTRKKV